MELTLPLMKKITLLCVYLFTVFHAIGQVKIGLGFGPHTSSVVEKNSLAGWDTAYKGFYSGRHGWHIGAVVEIPLDEQSRWAIQANPAYFNKGRNFSKSYDSLTAVRKDTSAINATLRLNYIDLPVNQYNSAEVWH